MDRIRRMKNKKGFTLVEILVVLAIMAILVAVAVPSIMGAVGDAQEKTSMSNARAAYIAYELKKSTSTTVTNSDIKSYFGTEAPEGLACGYDASTKTFMYTDKSLTGKYVKIVLGDKATIETGSITNPLG